MSKYEPGNEIDQELKNVRFAITQSTANEYKIPAAGINDGTPQGGPEAYYDLPKGAITLNDLMEWLAHHRWGSNSLYLFNIMKACFRWGAKSGTTMEYDAKKMVYYSLRLYGMVAGREKMVKYIKDLSKDPQFMERK